MDVCAVCAEPLEWTGYGPCGHMETCSKCVVQMRLIMNDKRCVICQQESEEVFVTRSMGNYTKRLSPKQFSKLQEHAKNFEVFHEPMINAFFDDEDHYKLIKSISSYTHPVLEGVPDIPVFKSIGSLRRFVQDQLGKQFCSICLEGRKVFLSEQIVYNKKDLARHLKQGDANGPLALAGFKGHPQCLLCSKRFYSDHELFLHNQQAHETCFICRRVNPGQYIYFRNYEELNDHFLKEHHPCPHPTCLEKKFVVFQSEAELKQHYAKDHKEDSGGLSRSQLREALALETNFQLRRGRQEEAVPADVDTRAAIVLGGGSNIQQRGTGGRRGHHAAQPARRAQDQGGPVGTLAEAGPSRQPDLTGADFPALQNSSGSAPSGSSSGNWAAKGGVHQGPSMQPKDFPDLPTGKAKKSQPAWVSSKPAKAPQRSNWGASSAKPSVKVIKTAMAKPSKVPPPSSAQAGKRLVTVEQSPSRHKSPPDQPGPRIGPSRYKTIPAKPTGPALPPEKFPALSSTEPDKNGPQPKWKAAEDCRKPPKENVGKQRAQTPAKEDFPNLSAKPRSKPNKASQNKQGAADLRPNITEELKVTTRSLASKIKMQVERPDYERLKATALDFCDGVIQADDYHDIIVELGIVQHAGELAAVCPIIPCGQDLFEVHQRFVELAQLYPACAPATVPVSVLVDGLKTYEEKGLAWSCSACKVINAPQADFCEQCGSTRPAKKNLAERPSSSSRKKSGQSRNKIPGHCATDGWKKRDNNQGLFEGKVRSKAGTSAWDRH